MSLSEQERDLLLAAGSAAEQTTRGQAVAILLSKSGEDAADARALLADSFAATTQPSFHLIPRGDAMTSEAEFDAAYAVLGQRTEGFTRVNLETLRMTLLQDGAALAPLRMIIGFTNSELSAATRIVTPAKPVSVAAMKGLEEKRRQRRQPPPSDASR